MDREQQIQTKSKSHKTVEEEDKAKSVQGSEKQEVEEEREGTLKMVQVQNLPDDVDMIVGQLKTLDFGI